MEIRNQINNTAFKMNVFVAKKSLLTRTGSAAINMAVEGKHIKKDSIAGLPEETATGYLIFEKGTPADILMQSFSRVKSRFLSSKEPQDRIKMRDLYLGILNDLAEAESTVKL